MKERPIIFSGEMVRAILDVRKSQTRRVMKVQPPEGVSDLWICHSTTGHKSKIGKGHWAKYDDNMQPIYEGKEYFACPYGKPGDRLWVKETWQEVIDLKAGANYKSPTTLCGKTLYRADNPRHPHLGKWKPSIYMPRWASRITLEMKNIRVERIQNISEADAKAEGVVPLQMDMGSFLPRFEGLWDRINEKRGYGWDKNPWVWVIEFERVK